MDVPLSNTDIKRALEGVEGFRGVFSYDLLPSLDHGEFCIITSCLYGINLKVDTIG